MKKTFCWPNLGIIMLYCFSMENHYFLATPRKYQSALEAHRQRMGKQTGNSWTRFTGPGDTLDDDPQHQQSNPHLLGKLCALSRGVVARLLRLRLALGHVVLDLVLVVERLAHGLVLGGADELRALRVAVALEGLLADADGLGARDGVVLDVAVLLEGLLALLHLFGGDRKQL